MVLNDRKLFWAYIILTLIKDLIVLAERRQENDGGDILETVNPFPPLWTLTAHVHHPGDTRPLI